MDLQKRRERPSNNALCLAAIQIARATGSDLHFSLQCDAATAYMLPSIIPLCIVSASRWKCLELTVQNPVMLNDFKMVAPMLDCLESLHIRIHDGRLPLPGAHISSIFKDACHLTEVVGSSYDLARIILPWINIEKVILTQGAGESGRDRLDHESMVAWTSCLREMWQQIKSSPVRLLILRDGSLRRLLQDTSHQDNVLRFLQILVVGNHGVGPLLGHVVAPGLGALYIRDWHSGEMAILTRFIRRSATPSHPLHLSLKLQGLGLLRRGMMLNPTKRSLESIGTVLSQTQSQYGYPAVMQYIIECDSAANA